MEESRGFCSPSKESLYEACEEEQFGSLFKSGLLSLALT